MARPKDMNKHEFRLCKRSNCNNTFEVYKKSKKRYCSKKCSNTSKSLIKQKNISLKNTISVKYNGVHYMNNKDTQSKHKNTMKKRYGVEHALQSNNIMDSMKQNVIDKFGVDNVSKDIGVIEKIKQAKLNKYGNAGYNNVKVTYDRIFNKFLQWKHITPLFDRVDYIGSMTKRYKFKCNECNNILDVFINNGYIPHCKICNTNTISKAETEIVEYIKTIYDGEIIKNDRVILGGKELDIYLPDKKIAIEYNGLYWHGESNGKDKNYHLNKTKECENNGIRLIHIFSDEWNTKGDIVKGRLLHIIGLNGLNVYARKCNVKEITSKQKNEFLTKTHIQGKDTSSIHIGIFYRDQLSAIMTFGKLRRALGGTPKVGNYELIRFSSNLHIVGGASKLLSFFIKKYNPIKIISYADRRWSNGNLYEKIGFTKTSDGMPGYWYFKDDLFRYHRYAFRKDILPKKLTDVDMNLTEWENMQLNGYDRIWDCGHLKYEMTL